MYEKEQRINEFTINMINFDLHPKCRTNKNAPGCRDNVHRSIYCHQDSLSGPQFDQQPKHPSSPPPSPLPHHPPYSTQKSDEIGVSRQEMHSLARPVMHVRFGAPSLTHFLSQAPVNNFLFWGHSAERESLQAWLWESVIVHIHKRGAANIYKKKKKIQHHRCKDGHGNKWGSVCVQSTWHFRTQSDWPFFFLNVDLSIALYIPFRLWFQQRQK